MNIHEYQAKQLLQQSALPIPEFRCASSTDEAVEQARQLGGEAWVVKAQVHAGGRGKAGGVKLVNTLGELREVASNLLGRALITKQSAPSGQPVNTLLIQAAESIQSEFYLGLLVDRASRRVSIIASREGGMDIEAVASEQPDAISTVNVQPLTGLMHYQIRSLHKTLGLRPALLAAFTELLQKCYRVFIDCDLSLLEINPLILTTDGSLKVLDCKISIDDNALFRHPDLETLYDATQEDPKEQTARQHDLNYITLDGDIACMVNGAGLAMATMDIIKLHGGEPANFLDVGGNTDQGKVTAAFELILSDPKVKAILVNIFGGIVRCDVIAAGIIAAVESIDIKLPVVVRLEGTNVEQGKALLANSTLDFITASDLDDAAIKAVQASRSVAQG